MKRSRLESPGEKDRTVIPDPIDDRELPGMKRIWKGWDSSWHNMKSIEDL